jgi:hypothetical protein
MLNVPSNALTNGGPHAEDLMLAMEAFSRPAEFDLSVYGPFIRRNRFQRIIELGAGAGRLAPAWLATGTEVLLVETDPILRNNLHRRFRSALHEDTLTVVERLDEAALLHAPTVLLAPYNTALYLSSPREFAALIKRAARVGAEAVLFDVDNASDDDWENAFGAGPVYRQSGPFIERVELIEKRDLRVQWKRSGCRAVVADFNLFLHTRDELMSVITEQHPRAKPFELACLKDRFGADVSFIHVAL